MKEIALLSAATMTRPVAGAASAAAARYARYGSLDIQGSEIAAAVFHRV
jgi:hypothetical protein